jgi:hypothetical protein
MASVQTRVVVIDPNADLAICLQPRVTPIAAWPLAKSQAAKMEVNGSHPSPSSHHALDPEMEPESQSESEVIETYPVHFMVSSKHMTYSSRRFAKMLNGPWKEATTFYDDGLRHVDIEVLNLIHAKNNKIDPAPTIEELAEICLVVDDLGAQAAVGVIKDLWLREGDISVYKYRIQEFSKTKFDRNLILALFATQVLESSELFRSITRAIITTCPGDKIPTLGLPIRDDHIREYPPLFL